jgi:ABC-type polysaccharide/polyol phosphate transport system ATPase subunit
VKSGSIIADRVGRSFRLRTHGPVTLKDVVLRRSHGSAAEVNALRAVTFEVKPGESVGIIGRNGAGKTTLLRLVAKIFAPTSGSLAVEGSVGCLLELGAGFQPELTGRENVYLNAALHGLRQGYVREHLDEVVGFAELEDSIDLPVRTYSAGMYMRLGFSVAMHLDRDIILLDEVFAVGDEAFQRKCFGKILAFKQRGGTILFVSHSSATLERLCERGILLSDGAVVGDGPAADVVRLYRRLLAEDESPAEAAAGAGEWGTGEARLAAARLLDSEGMERLQYLAGEPFSLLVEIDIDAGIEAPQLTIDIRDSLGLLLGTNTRNLAELGFYGATHSGLVRFDIAELPLAEGRFHVGLTLAPRDGRPVYHRLERACEFLVYPSEGAAGPVRLAGSWSAELGRRRTTRS